jgi:tetratricopeptide (TPR) repeat protein
MAQYFFAKNRALAAQIIESYGQYKPDSWKYYYLKGMYALNSGDRAQGKKMYELALQKSPPEYLIDFLNNTSYYVW